MLHEQLAVMWHTTLSILIIFPLLSVSQLTDDPDHLLDWCLDAKNHKSKPGPESNLYSQCTPWKKRSCCTSETAVEVHHTIMYKFDYDHCGHIKNMSEDCLRHFRQDLCFYECSPNIGPWAVKVNMKTRNERFYKVPLCQSDCNSWYDSCISDYTCTSNWVRNWDWSPTGNKCTQHAECKTFKEIFGSAKSFCEKVWDDSWEYTPDDEPCMRLWFNGTKGNPNDNIAKLRVAELMRQRNAGVCRNPTIVPMFVTFTIYLVSFLRPT